MEIVSTQSIGEILISSCKRYKSIEIFNKTLDRLENEDLPIARFVNQLEGHTSWSIERREHFFGKPREFRGPKPEWVFCQIPAFRTFLKNVALNTDHSAPSSPALMIHDLIGHILLENPTNAYGEILACAGSAGFSWDAGSDYFVNSLLMFSMEIPIFEDIEIGSVPFDSALAQDCNRAYSTGKSLRINLNSKDIDLTSLAFHIVESWPCLTKNLSFLKKQNHMNKQPFHNPISTEKNQFSAVSVNLKLVGSNCNMRCSYCYEHDTPIWSKQLLHPVELYEFIISFPSQTFFRFLLHGGEPLLYKKNEMRRLLKTITYLAGDRSTVQIQTNGTLLDDGWIDLFLEYDEKFVFSISLDTLSHDVNRKLPKRDFSQTIREKIELLRSRKANVGIVSVISRDNTDNFCEFLEQLIDLDVKYLSVSKLRHNSVDRVNSNPLVLSEMKYVHFLENLLYFWMENRLFRKIQIQPFMSLMSSFSNRICTFESNADKCNPFFSLYPGGLKTGCDHRVGTTPHIFSSCTKCQIAEWCGGGCLGEEKDPTFCDARFHLKSLIDSILK